RARRLRRRRRVGNHATRRAGAHAEDLDAGSTSAARGLLWPAAQCTGAVACSYFRPLITASASHTLHANAEADHAGAEATDRGNVGDELDGRRIDARPSAILEAGSQDAVLYENLKALNDLGRQEAAPPNGVEIVVGQCATGGERLGKEVRRRDCVLHGEVDS